ncbi:hypothetical protein C499_02227 [Halogeometricum borinquense DSM 11551]|uniref:Uncharacterized protein n=3 Tax=Halogeometricum borinquense TaxID=60847 RepID=E4NPQ3_HALBP|nr:hypothetical protein Hbor_09420 [Halogeometricum borinquense DSM 11551]ELY31011.1 hypothetical protein C499_02227 [Halogeometricum borinquense DSM 11551]RYJ15412.1 hypothetical protein ELS19_10830 [Halogeometricum borinquense]
MLAVFLAGFALSLQDTPLGRDSAFVAVISGLAAVVAFQFTVGNIWGYAVEYYNAGGSWTDLPFLTPFVAAIAVGAVTYFRIDPVLGAAAWAAFWTFIVVAGIVAVVTQFSAGYRESTA